MYTFVHENLKIVMGGYKISIRAYPVYIVLGDPIIFGSQTRRQFTACVYKKATAINKLYHHIEKKYSLSRRR